MGILKSMQAVRVHWKLSKQPGKNVRQVKLLESNTKFRLCKAIRKRKVCLSENAMN